MWAGVDVGGRRKGFHAAVVGPDRLVAGSEQLPSPAAVVAWLGGFRLRLSAVDSPRSPAPKGSGSRPCERALARAICGIRYTPELARLEGNAYYEWIVNGLELYAALEEHGLMVIECFPTASFTRWAGARGAKTRAAWSHAYLASLGFAPDRHGQDGRDAVAAALTARCYDEGSFEAFGEIIVPQAPVAATSGPSARAGRRSARGTRARGTAARAGRG
jgi:predicted nuclease with RNAse H fold